jgi:hypothetical protein
MKTAKEYRARLTPRKVDMESFVFLSIIEQRLDQAVERGLPEFTVNVPPYISEDSLHDAKEVLKEKGFTVYDRQEEGLLERGLYYPPKRYLILSY